MRKYVCVLVTILGFSVCFLKYGVVSAQVCQEDSVASSRVVSIGIVTDGSTPEDMALVELYRKEISSVLGPEFRVKFSPRWIVSGNDSPEGVRKALNKLFAGPKPDIVIALGAIASFEALNRGSLQKPTIAPFVADFFFKSGKYKKNRTKNLIYIDSIYYLDDDIYVFKEIAPFKHIGLILDEREVRAFPGLGDIVRKFGKRHGIRVSVISAGSSADKLLEAISDDIEAVLVGPLWHFSADQVNVFSRGLIKKKIPGFAIWDFSQVQNGLLAGLETRDKQRVLAKRTAVAIMDILRGEAPENIEVKFVRTRDLVVNMDTARQLQLYPSLLLITGATVLNERPSGIKRTLTVKTAVDEAVSANLQLRSAEVEVLAGRYAVREVMADLLPRIDMETGFRQVDEDRAEVGGGMTPESVWTGSAVGSVLIYSEKRWASYTAEEHLQEAREMKLERVKLDVTYQAAVAYLNVLRAKTIEQIFKENLSLTKANLERAKIRVSTGAAGPDEVYRWESKYANDKRFVLRRESDTLTAMETLNRILHRPLQEPFELKETTLEDPLFIMGSKFFLKLMENPILIERFKDFASKKAVELRPELKAIDAAINAKERLRVAAKREIWLPDFSVEWRVDQYFDEAGKGQREPSTLDDTDWSVGIFARIPLFEGGKTLSRLRRLEKEVSKLRTDRDAGAEVIVQQVLAAINKTRASYPSISLTRDAEESARKNLNLVIDSYIHGIKTIIDVLDAQNQYLKARLDAANAVYDFLIDYMGVQRAIGQFSVFMPPDMRKQWIDEVTSALGMNSIANSKASYY